MVERIVRGLLALLAVTSLADINMGTAQGDLFAFAGFHRDMDLAALLDRYPLASHDVSPGAGVHQRTSQG